MPATSILAFIVPKLGIQAENAVSACFHFLISTHPEIANAFMRYVSFAGVELPSPLELRDTIATVADDLAAYPTWDVWAETVWSRYPGY